MKYSNICMEFHLPPLLFETLKHLSLSANMLFLELDLKNEEVKVNTSTRHCENKTTIGLHFFYMYMFVSTKHQLKKNKLIAVENESHCY